MEELVSEGGFRKDLYFRLRVVEIDVPSLRARRADVPLLANHLLSRVRRETGADTRHIAESAMQKLVGYDWPGNVRELKNALIRAAIVARGPVVGPEHLTLGLPDNSGPEPEEPVAGEEKDWTLDGAVERQIRHVLEKTGGNKTKAARLLGVSRSRLATYVECFGL